MKVKVIIAALILAAGIGSGAYYYSTMDKSIVSTAKTETQDSEKTASDTENTKSVSSDTTNNEAAKSEVTKSQGTSTADSSGTASDAEKQSKLVNKDIGAIQSVLKSNSIKSSTAGDFSKDSKVTLNASSDKISKISYVGESKGGVLSRTLTIALKYATTDEFDITKYGPAKDLIEKFIQSPLNDFEFSDGLTAKVSSSKDTKISYDFIAGDDYKISVDINKNAAETVTIKVELK